MIKRKKTQMADRMQNEKAPVTIKYHAGFVSGLELLLWRYREQVAIEAEKWLSTEGIRMDVLILKKDPSVELDFDIGRIFRVHNILEYKRPDDKLKEDPEMCEALRELMKDELKDEFEKTEARGAIRVYRDEMDLPPEEIVKRIMVRFDLKQEAAEKYVEETLGLQPV